MRRLGEGRSDLRALDREAGNRERGRGGAAAVGAAIAAVAVIEAVYELGAAHRGRAFVPDDLLHLIAPELAFLGAAQLAQIVDGTEDLGEPQKLRVIGPVVRRGRRRALPRNDRRQVVCRGLRLGWADLLALRLLLLEERRPEELCLGHGRPAEHRDSEHADPESKRGRPSFHAI
jgi:hypothetical protein